MTSAPFHIGQRVQLTAAARQAGLGKRSGDLGVVEALSRSGVLVRVREDGRKTASNYRADYWEPVPEAQEDAR